MDASTLIQVSEDDMPSEEAEDSSSSTQSWEIPEVPADSNFVDGVASEDVVVDESLNVWVRIFLPESALTSSSKLPLLVHVHGGGFVRFSAATLSYHEFCKKLARDATVVVVSLNHRLAPEYRLPAAYDDLIATLKWLQGQAKDSSRTSTKDPWLANYADFSRLIFMGGSSGGNIVHNTLVQLAGTHLLPLKFQAQVLLQPFFGGILRSKSELRLSEAPILTLSMSDQLWSLALPEGANRDHPFCNPKVTPISVFEKASLPKALVLVGGRDLLHDRQVEYASLLKRAGVNVKLVEYPDATHGFVGSDGTVSYVFMPEVLKFIDSCHCNKENLILSE